jgi:hypothetical protein
MVENARRNDRNRGCRRLHHFSGFQMHYAGQQRDAAHETLRTTKGQFQFDQRPHVAMAGIGIMDFQTHKPAWLPTIGKPVAVTIGFKNVGKSPALKLVVHRHILFDSNMSSFKIEPMDETISGDALAGRRAH